jgi:hypothetical protein
MRIVTWNLGAAFGPYREDHDRAWRALLGLGPDLALVQEAIPPPWLSPEWHVIVGPFQFWASAIVSRRPLEPVVPEPESHLGRFGSYLAIARYPLEGGATATVASVHERTRPASDRLLRGLDAERLRRPSVPEPWWNDVVWHGLAELVRKSRFIIGGDWNTSRYVDQDGESEPAGREFMDRAEADGWVDLHQRAMGREERSWYGTLGPREHQPDIIFSDAVTASGLVSCWVEQRMARDEHLSDHAPVIADLR